MPNQSDISQWTGGGDGQSNDSNLATEPTNESSVEIEIGDEKQQIVDDHISDETVDKLNDRQLVYHVGHIKNFKLWMVNCGKDQEQRIGLAETTVSNNLARLDQIYRRVWAEKDGYSAVISQEMANKFVYNLAEDNILTQNREPYSKVSKRKFSDTLIKYFEWLKITHHEEEWTPPVDFSDGVYNSPDKLTRSERTLLREASLSLGSIKNYKSLDPAERDRMKALLAQRLGKPKSEVTPGDFQRANQSWEIASLVHTALDAGLRPIEVEKASTEWLKLEKETLHIPRGDAAKNDEHWEVTLSSRTADLLDYWQQEREVREKYDGSNRLSVLPDRRNQLN